MGDYSGIGEAMVAVVILVAFATPALIAAIISIIAAALGAPPAVYVSIAGIGLIAGITCGFWVASQS